MEQNVYIELGMNWFLYDGKTHNLSNTLGWSANCHFENKLAS